MNKPVIAHSRLPEELHHLRKVTLSEWCEVWTREDVSRDVTSAVAILHCVERLGMKELFEQLAPDPGEHYLAVGDAEEAALAALEEMWRKAVAEELAGREFQHRQFALGVRALARSLYDVLLPESKSFVTLSIPSSN